MHILWLKTEFLHPVDKGGRIRTYQMLRCLARRHRVTYLTLDDGGSEPDAEALAAEYAQTVVRIPFRPPAKGSAAFYADLALNLGSPLPYAIAKYRSDAFRDAIGRLAPTADLLVCDFLAPAVNLPGRVPVPAVLFQHNVEAEIWRRHAAVATNPVARMYFAGQWRRMVRFEREACLRFDRVVAVSAPDAEHFRNQYGARSVTAIPTGVDLEYFRPDPATARQPDELVFSGSMDWLPNEDGVSWFAEQVLPRIRARRPATTLTIVGRTPSAKVRALGDKHAGVTVTGTVPDIRPYLRRAAALVVPLRIGGGTRLKIYEAMAMGIPVVSTAVGAEGLPVEPGRHFLEADSPDALAAACLRLLDRPADARALGDAGCELVRARFGWEHVTDAFLEACEQASGPAPREPQWSQG